MATSVLLAAIGDAMGFEHEFNYDTTRVLSHVWDKYVASMEEHGFLVDDAISPSCAQHPEIHLRCLPLTLPKAKQPPQCVMPTLVMKRVSDDTVMHMATIDALADIRIHAARFAKDAISIETFRREILCAFSRAYLTSLSDMIDRAPGNTCMKARDNLARSEVAPFSERAGGNGAAMRSMAIGLAFPHKWQQNQMVEIAVTSAMTTHNHPTAVLGAVMSAAFAAFAYKQIPIVKWPALYLIQIVPLVIAYMRVQFPSSYETWRLYEDRISVNDHQVEGLTYLPNWRFIRQWVVYLDARFGNASMYLLSTCMSKSYAAIAEWQYKGGAVNGVSFPAINDNPASNDTTCCTPSWPDDWLINHNIRDRFWRDYSFDGWPGASGDDGPMMAYDALLSTYFGGEGQWGQLMYLSAFHGGDSDSTATMAAAWYGALYSNQRAASSSVAADDDQFPTKDPLCHDALSYWSHIEGKPVQLEYWHLLDVAAIRLRRAAADFNPTPLFIPT